MQDVATRIEVRKADGRSAQDMRSSRLRAVETPRVETERFQDGQVVLFLDHQRCVHVHSPDDSSRRSIASELVDVIILGTLDSRGKREDTRSQRPTV